MAEPGQKDISFKPKCRDSPGEAPLIYTVLSLLSKERGIYGLRNGDHERYRKHCSNKIHRLRQVTQLTAGKGKVYKKPPSITDVTSKDGKHLLLLLFSAERALAHSHELRAARSKPNPPSSARKDQLTWLRRALKISTQLHSIASSLSSGSGSAGVNINQQTFAEVTIYHLSIRSELAFERSQWGEAITDLAVRRRLLATLADAAQDSYDQALSLEFMDELDPLIRFSAYKLGRAESHDIPAVVADIDSEMQEEAVPGVEVLVGKLREEVGAKEAEEGRKMLEETRFAGEKIEMRSAEIVKVMGKVKAAVAALGAETGDAGRTAGGDGDDDMKGKGGKVKVRGGMKGWDKVLSVLGEAEAVARRLMDDHEASGATNALRSAETTRALSLTHQYTVHLLLTYRIRRDLILVESLLSASKALPADPATFKIPGGKVRVEEAVKTVAGVVKLYDQILQSVGQLRALGLVQDRDGVREGVEGLDSYFHATRNYHLARLHCIHPTPSYSSAIRLLSRCALLKRQARSDLFDTGIEILEPITAVTAADVSTLESQISALELAAKRALFAERVDKPVFYDTAFNYIDLPMDELLYLAGKGPKPAPAPALNIVTNALSGAAKTVASKAGDAAGMVVDQVEQIAPAGAAVPEKVKGLVRSTRESTPAVEKRPSRAVQQQVQEDEDSEEQEEEVEGKGAKAEQQGTPGKKGWLGGWFGRG